MYPFKKLSLSSFATGTMPVGCENQVLATMCHSKRVIVLQLIVTRSLAVTK